MNSPQFNLALLTVVLLPSIPYADTVSKRVELDGIKHIHMLGTYDLSITQGDREYVIVTADSEVLDQIEAKMQGSKIILGRDNNNWSGYNASDGIDADFELQVKELRSVSNMGTGNVLVSNIDSDEDLAFSNMGIGQFTVNSVKGDSISIHNLGAGGFIFDNIVAKDITENSFGAGRVEYVNLRAEGMEIKFYGGSHTYVQGNSTVDEIEISVVGAGVVDAEALRAEKAEIELQGAGRVNITVTDELDVEINGNGSVFYGGEPEVKKSISGSGSVAPLRQ